MIEKLGKTGKLNVQDQLREQARARLARSWPSGKPPIPASAPFPNYPMSIKA